MAGDSYNSRKRYWTLLIVAVSIVPLLLISAVILYDFRDSDREKVTAHLEELVERIPSLVAQRMRLTRFSGEQAREAILRPAGHLVDATSAARIVEFVSAAADGSTVSERKWRGSYS